MITRPARPALGGVRSPGRVAIGARRLRTDRWWAFPLTTFSVLLAFVAYAAYAAIADRDYYAAPYLSPFYSPCLSFHCGSVPGSRGAPNLGWFRTWWIVTPAVIILVFPLGFRLTCYYYRKAYYRSWWLSPPACAVAGPHRPLHRRDPVPAHRPVCPPVLLLRGAGLQRDPDLGRGAAFDFGGHTGIGAGSMVLVVNPVLLWLYSLSCHACQHAVGGRLKDFFSRHPVRYRLWTFVFWLNPYHGVFAWASLTWVALTDLYVRLVTSGAIHDPRFF